MQQGSQNALDKLRKRSPKGRRAPSRLPIYTYTRAPHNVNGEIAHCALRSSKAASTSTTSGRLRCCVHAQALRVLSSGEARLGRLPVASSSTSFTAMP